MKKTKVGIIGGAGYTAGELVRVLLHHEAVELAFVQSRSQAGKPLTAIHSDLLGYTSLSFVNAPLAELLAQNPEVKVIFLALGHGDAQKYLEPANLASDILIIDLSQDFRLHSNKKLGDRTFLYGLPEVHREKIRSAKSIANPGCFASAIQFSLLPLARAKKLKNVYVTGVTGSTGAGQSLSVTSHFSFRANNIQAYKTLNHQHVNEIQETLAFLQENNDAKVSFVPWRGDFTRGIFVSSQLECDLPKAEVMALFQKFYEGHPFITVTDQPIDLKSVVNTNRAMIEINQNGSTLAVHCVIDNLLKGASGQAVQNMNLMLGLAEDMGLKLKGVAF